MFPNSALRSSNNTKIIKKIGQINRKWCESNKSYIQNYTEIIALNAAENNYQK